MPPVDWRRGECGCGWEKCLQLDSFLGNPSQEESSISAGNEDGVQHLTSHWLASTRPLEREVPEYETQVERGFTLKVRKMAKAWPYALKAWEEDRDAARTVFDKVIDDEERGTA
ncbi:hypothetical protein LTR93_011128 [Exophiala xenobiotica]|nr:hypothetical protein LTR93_011128 [Exophiala xenobiotica]